MAPEYTLRQGEAGTESRSVESYPVRYADQYGRTGFKYDHVTRTITRTIHTKRFHGIRPKDTDYNPNRKVDPKDLPPAVFMLYGMNKPLPKVKMLGSFQVSPGIRAEARKPSGISFDDMLQQVFMPSARYKRKNAQRWRTQKYYNNYP